MEPNICLKRRHVFYNNMIILLGNATFFEKKYGTAFHKDIFAVPNKKGFEAVMNFLFLKLSSITHKDYKLPWPLMSKDQERLFQKTCCSHLVTFAQEDVVRFPNIVPSVLSSFGGDRIYETFLALSTYVLLKVMKKEGVSVLHRPSIKKENWAAASSILKLSTITAMKAFRQTEMISHSNYLFWAKLAQNLSECLEDLKKSISSNEKLRDKELSNLRLLLNMSPGEKVEVKKVVMKILELHNPAMQAKLEKFYAKEKGLWTYLESEIGDTKERIILNGQDFASCSSVPDFVLSESKNVENFSTQVDGKFSVIGFLKQLNVSLKYIAEILKKADLSLFEESCPVDVSTMEDSLGFVNKLVKCLEEEVIPGAENRIKVLKSEVGWDNLITKSNVKSFPFLPMQSFNPEAVRERVAHFEPGELCPDLSSDIKEKENFSHSSFNMEKSSGESSVKKERDETVTSGSGEIFPCEETFSPISVSENPQLPVEKVFSPLGIDSPDWNKSLECSGINNTSWLLDHSLTLHSLSSIDD